jgi:hypothetical protein
MRALLRRFGRWIQDLGQEPEEVFDRANGERDPKPHDHCHEFRPGTASGDCQTDGHYLCDGCSLMDPVVAYYRANGDWPPDGWNEETAP